MPQRLNSHRNRTVAGPRCARIRRISSVLLVLAAGVALGAQGAAAAIIEVQYNLSGRILQPSFGTVVATFSGSEPARLWYRGAGLLTISHGPLNLAPAPHTVITNVVLPGVWNLTGMSVRGAEGTGELASNGVLTLQVSNQTHAGFVHCFDLTPLGCQTFAMLGASLMIPLTGSLSRVALVGNFGSGQPPATFTLDGNNVGGASTLSTWTFSEIPGSRTIVPEPASGGLLGLGLLGLALAGARLRARRL